jgi:hypothetical protein
VDQLTSGQGPPPLGLTDLVSQAWRMYRSWAHLLVPTFAVAFVVLRELLLVALLIDLPALGLLLVVTLIQAVIPAFVGSVLIAPAVLVLAEGSGQRLRQAWAALAARRTEIYRAASWSGVLALFAAITLGPVGIIVQPMLLGPPLLIHEVVLKRHPLNVAWERSKQMMGRDNRTLLYLLIIPAGVGLVLSLSLRGFGVLSGDVPSVARGIIYFAVQGALIGAATPYVAAVALLCYRDLASTLGGDP